MKQFAPLLKNKIMSKVYYDETLKSGERVVVSDTCIEYRKNYRKDKKKTIPLKSITKISRRPGIGPILKNGLFYALFVSFGVVVGNILSELNKGNSVEFTETAICFVVAFLLSVFMFGLISFFVKGVYVENDKTYFYLSRKDSSVKKEDCNRLLNAIKTAMEENNTVIQ